MPLSLRRCIGESRHRKGGIIGECVATRRHDASLWPLLSQHQYTGGLFAVVWMMCAQKSAGWEKGKLVDEMHPFLALREDYCTLHYESVCFILPKRETLVLPLCDSRVKGKSASWRPQASQQSEGFSFFF